MPSLFMVLMLQATRTSLSKPVIIGAALFLILAVVAVVYFFRRAKNTEREAEDDWADAGNKLFAVESRPSPPAQTQELSSPPPPPEAEPIAHAAPPIEPAARVSEEPVQIHPPAFEPEPPIQPPTRSVPVAEPPRPDVPLTSTESLPAPVALPESASPFDDEIWEQLGDAETAQDAPLAGMVNTVADEEDAPLAGMVRSAEVSQAPPQHARRVQPPARAVEATSPKEPQVVQAGVAKAGSILGLPAEPSSKPFVLGQATGQVGVGTITNYGQPIDDGGGGKGGTITLAVVILIIGGAVAAFFLSPRVHSGVTDWVAKMRGGAAIADETPKAQVFALRPELSKEKTQAIAKGTVINISNQDLTGLAIEIALTRKDNGPSDNRRISITPDTIAPNQQGAFEFELDPAQHTGYKVSNLFNAEGKEIRFTTPAQQAALAQPTTPAQQK